MRTLLIFETALRKTRFGQVEVFGVVFQKSLYITFQQSISNQKFNFSLFLHKGESLDKVYQVKHPILIFTGEQVQERVDWAKTEEGDQLLKFGFFGGLYCYVLANKSNHVVDYRWYQT